MQRQSVRNLPANKHPLGTRCVTIEIPDDDEWERMAYSELYRLALWMLWERDVGKNGKVVARRWRDALDTWKHCPPPPAPVGGLLEDFEMPLRVDCDCNVFVTCCDGTEKQILTADQVQALITGQPGAGAPQPPAGGCQTYSALVSAGGAWLLPTLVNAGDTLQFTDVQGATTDVAPIGRWNCPDGEIFVAGTCGGLPIIDGSALLPTSPIGIPIFNLDGTWYPAQGLFTVPGGISNKPISFAVNYAPGGNFAGNLTLKVQVCNNAAATWSISQDLTANPGHWTPTLQGFDGSQSDWVVGGGWREVACTPNTLNTARYDIVYLDLFFDTPTTITHMDMVYDASIGDLSDGGGDTVNYWVSGVQHVLTSQASATASNRAMSWDGSIANVERMTVLLYGADLTGMTCPSPGTAQFRTFNLRGTGTPPLS